MVEYLYDKRQLIQYDTIGKGTEVAERLRQVIGKTLNIRGIKVSSRQPIIQTDGHSCGRHVMELICQLSRGVESPKSYLTRTKFCEELKAFGFTVKSENLEHLADESLIFGGGPPVQTVLTKFLTGRKSDGTLCNEGRGENI